MSETEDRNSSLESIVVQIQTPTKDRKTRGRKLMKFKVTVPAMVFVLYDDRSSTVPMWILHGFSDRCVYKCEELPFAFPYY